MKNLVIATIIAFTAHSPAFSQQTQVPPQRIEIGGESPSSKASPGTSFLPDENPFSEFTNELNAALQAHNVVALQALYQTNSVSAEEMERELARWRPILEGKAKPGVAVQERGTIFRDLSKSNVMWRGVVERATTHKATHLVELYCNKYGYWLNLPLVEVEGRLCIVPSDKRESGFGSVQPGAAPNSAPPPR